MPQLLLPLLRTFTGRRSFLKQSGGAVLSTTAIALLAGRKADAADQSTKVGAMSDANILNTMLGSEFGAIAAYQLAADSGLLQKPVQDLAVQFQGQHRAHSEFLIKTVKTLGGNPVEPKPAADYKFPVDTLKNQTDVLRFAAGLEWGAATAYLNTVPQLGSRDLAKDAASIMGDEAMHWAILRQALGENPVPVVYIGDAVEAPQRG